MSKYNDYQEKMKSEIISCIETMECLPILFIGSGLSKRYFNAPNWDELLEILCSKSTVFKEFAFYKQNYKENAMIGSILAKEYNSWAWDAGRTTYDEELFKSHLNSDIFIKKTVATHIESITPNSISEVADIHKAEVTALKKISPHAIITTNYDKFLENIFTDYEVIIGQKILRTQYQSIGEIFKIHGSVEEYADIVFTSEDYDDFLSRKKYLSAKLLTYFLEHPIFIMGYSISDLNVKAILSDIDEILVSNGDLVPNIFLVEWKESIDLDKDYPSESLISLEYGKNIRIKTIYTNEFRWIYECLSTDCPIENVNPKLLRALLSRTYELVRTDVPRRTVEIDYTQLKSALDDRNEIGKIFGITTLTNASIFNINYPFSLTEVAKRLDFGHWHHANKLLDKIKESKGICIKESDNLYHIAILNGNSVIARKYSQELIDLLKKVKNEEDYEVNL